MKLQELKNEIVKYQYFEDTDIIDISIASVIATRLALGDPVWIILIAPSSSGKSQILRPLSLTDEKFIHKVDDLTENTFLSGTKSTGGEVSLLNRIGTKGIIVISDLTVLFSKNSEARATILSQFRMIYDGEMTKHSGNSSKPLHWKGYLGIIAGSTPSIYQNFEEVSDMGERFMYYRMKDFDAEKATRLSMQRKVFGKELDNLLSLKYEEYIKGVATSYNNDPITLPEFITDRIIKISMLAERIRTTAHKDFYKEIDRIPVPAMPMRVALQLTTLAKALTVMRRAEGGQLDSKDLHIIDWCGYSLANEEKRAVLRILAKSKFEDYINTQTIADIMGLGTDTVRVILQNLTAVGILERGGSDGGLTWKFSKKEDYELVREVEIIKDERQYSNRNVTDEERKEMKDLIDEEWNNM